MMRRSTQPDHQRAAAEVLRNSGHPRPTGRPARMAEQTRAASLAQSEGTRRAGLLAASRRVLRSISDELLEHLDEAAPTAPVQRRAEGWNMSLNGVRLGLSAGQPFDGKNWGGWDAPPIDVIGSATVSITSRPIVRATRDEAIPSTTATPTSSGSGHQRSS